MSSYPSSPAHEFPNILLMKTSVRRSGASSLWRTITWTILVMTTLILLAVVYSQQQDACRKPITYRIGSVDPRFGLSRRDVSEAVSKAASLWSKASNRELFRESPKGDIEVNFIYDYRQEAADKLKHISGDIDSTKDSYETLTARFRSLESEFKEKQAALAADIDAYNARMSDFKARSSAAASQRGGVSREVYQDLKEEKEVLDAQYMNLQTQQREVNETADTLNSMATVINEIASDLNLDVAKYNRTGERLKDEFSEGFYERKNGRQSITIFHFSSRTRLVRVLAHELGHALGIEHNGNPKALMYRMNKSDALELAPEDIASLKSRCGSK